MLRKIARVGSTMSAIPFGLHVQAAEQRPTESMSLSGPTSKSDRVLVRDLPLYGDPKPVEFDYIPEKVSLVQQNMTPVTEMILATASRCEKFLNIVSVTQRTATDNVKDYLKYLREDSGAMPRAAFITVAGLGGVIGGYKGGVMRKTLFAGIAMGAASSVCYPEQAINLSRQGWLLTREQAAQLWQQRAGGDEKPVQEGSSAAEVGGESREGSGVTKNTVTVSDQDNQSKQPKVDLGMSTPEDKDMYTTRSS